MGLEGCCLVSKFSPTIFAAIYNLTAMLLPLAIAKYNKSMRDKYFYAMGCLSNTNIPGDMYSQQVIQSLALLQPGCVTWSTFAYSVGWTFRIASARSYVTSRQTVKSLPSSRLCCSLGRCCIRLLVVATCSCQIRSSFWENFAYVNGWGLHFCGATASHEP